MGIGTVAWLCLVAAAVILWATFFGVLDWTFLACGLALWVTGLVLERSPAVVRRPPE